MGSRMSKPSQPTVFLLFLGKDVISAIPHVNVIHTASGGSQAAKCCSAMHMRNYRP
jgi:hypothetical protein